VTGVAVSLLVYSLHSLIRAVNGQLSWLVNVNFSSLIDYLLKQSTFVVVLCQRVG